MFSVTTPGFWVQFANAMDLSDLLGQEEYRDAPHGLGQQTQQQLYARLAKRFREQSAQAWAKHLQAADIPCSVVQSLETWLAQPQLAAVDAIAHTDGPEHHSVRQPGVLVELSRTPGAVRAGAPAAGQHSREVLKRLGYTAQEVAQMEREGLVRCHPS